MVRCKGRTEIAAPSVRPGQQYLGTSASTARLPDVFTRKMPHGKRSRKRKPQLVHDFGFLDGDDDGTLLDRRERLASDVPIRLERGSRQRSAPPPSPAREAAQLHAVRRLGELFERRCACLGAKHWHKHFEAWLWAVRAESESEIVPVVPQAQAGSVAQTALCAQLVRAGLAESRARDACDALAACAARLADELRAAATAEAEVSVSRLGFGFKVASPTPTPTSQPHAHPHPHPITLTLTLTR